MKAETSFGIDASDAWLAFSVMVAAPIRADIRFWFSGAIIRSWLEIWYQFLLLLQDRKSVV